MGNEGFGIGIFLQISGVWIDRRPEIVISCVCLLIIVMVLITCVQI
jgi:hypothetical protein